MKTDYFADIRDKRLSELTDEQKDRAAELWLRDNFGWEDRRLHPVFESVFKVIDRLREENARYQAVASEANVTVPAAAHSDDIARLDFLEADGMTHLFSIGGRWYARESRGLPHRRVPNLREAIDRAMKANGL